MRPTEHKKGNGDGKGEGEDKGQGKDDLSHVANGFDYGDHVEDSSDYNSENKKASIDPNRCYSPYYTPKPKLGSKGGILGRGAVDKSERKVQFSVTCTPDQKKNFQEAAKKDGRSLPNFVCKAIEEYIYNNNLK